MGSYQVDIKIQKDFRNRTFTTGSFNEAQHLISRAYFGHNVFTPEQVVFDDNSYSSEASPTFGHANANFSVFLTV